MARAGYTAPAWTGNFVARCRFPAQVREMARAVYTAPALAGKFVARCRSTAQARNGACGLHRARVGGNVLHVAVPPRRRGTARAGCTAPALAGKFVAHCRSTAQARNGACGLHRARVGGNVLRVAVPPRRRGTARAGCTAPAWAGNFVARCRFTAVGAEWRVLFHRQRQGTALYIYISNTIFAYFRSFVKCFFDILELFFKKCK